jgi:uncharacterized short protein YbdD (DUF466 family)
MLVGIPTILSKFSDYNYESIRRMLLSVELSSKIFRRTPKARRMIDMKDFEDYIELQKRNNAERVNPAFNLYRKRG